MKTSTFQAEAIAFVIEHDIIFIDYAERSEARKFSAFNNENTGFWPYFIKEGILGLADIKGRYLEPKIF